MKWVEVLQDKNTDIYARELMKLADIMDKIQTIINPGPKGNWVFITPLNHFISFKPKVHDENSRIELGFNAECFQI